MSLPDPTTAFYLLGPTAVGKSELAVQLAEQCDGEIVGADAFQVYQGLDLLTAKPAPDLLARTPHHLVGEIPLLQSWDVAQWVAAARERITAIQRRGRRAIVVGGAGLYFRALTRGLADLPPADPVLRAELNATPLPDLQDRLRRLDPQGAVQIDLQNPRRVIRALEVCLSTGQPFSRFREEWERPLEGVRGVILERDKTELYSRIEARTVEMFAQGVVEEVRAAGDLGPSASQVLGWREIRAHLAGEISRADCLAAIQQATRRYAKRQLTWFRRETALDRVTLSADTDQEELAAQLAQRAQRAREP